MPDKKALNDAENVQDDADDVVDTTGDEDAATDDLAEGDDNEYTPPTRDEWVSTQDALKRANGEAKKWRLKARDLEKGKTQDQDGDADAKAREAAEARYKPVVVKSAARAALVEAGVAADRVGKLMRLIDMSEVDVDDEGEVLGLDDQIESIKTDYPELFSAGEARQSRRIPRVTGADRQSPPVKKSVDELLAERLLGTR